MKLDWDRVKEEKKSKKTDMPGDKKRPTAKKKKKKTSNQFVMHWTERKLSYTRFIVCVLEFLCAIFLFSHC